MSTRLGIAFVLLAARATAFGDTLVVPNDQATTPGNMPLNLGGGNAVRIQEIVGGGQFGQYSGPIIITAIHVRSGVGTGRVSSNTPSVKITLSTTQAYPNTNNGHVLPSVTYADNVGPDATTVYNAALSFSSPGCSGPAPCPFDMTIPFTTPFSYDHTKGRLLVDILAAAPSGTSSGRLDAESFPDSTSSNVALVVGDPTQPAGTLALGGIVFELDILSAATAAPTVTAVLNLGDASSHLAPGAQVAIYGANFGSSVSGVTITVGGKTGYVSGVTPNQINAQLPFEAATGPTAITVTVAGVTSAPLNITLDAVAPAFLTLDNSGGGVVNGFNNTTKTAMTSVAPVKPGEIAVVYLTGLGATSPATPTGVASVTSKTAATPTLTIAGQPATVAASVLVAGGAGLYQVAFTVPAGVQGTVPIALSIGGKSTSPPSPVTIPVFGISSVVSNASFGSAGKTAAGSIVSLFGNGFGTTSQSVGFPGTTFQGVSVTFNGMPAPLFHLTITPPAGKQIGESQIDLLVPFELPASGVVQVAVNTPSATSPNYALTMVSGSPGMYYIADPTSKGRFNILAQFNATAWLDMPVSTATALGIPGNCSANKINVLSLCGQPAAPGDYMVLYLTGLGLATPNGDPNGKPLTTGNVPPADASILYQTVATPSVTVGGFPVTPIFSGMAPGFAGLYQIDFQVPTGVTGDDVPVVVSIAGSAPDTRTMSIQLR